MSEPFLPPAPEATAEVKCLGCGVVFGRCSADVLDIGWARVRHTLALECSRCGRKRVWRPAGTANGRPTVGMTHHPPPLLGG